MPFLQLKLRAHRREWPALEHALEDLGALSVSLADAHDDAIFEPKPGETPLWPELTVDVLFAAEVDRRGLLAALQELAPALGEDRIATEEIGDADWTRAWMDSYEPMRFGSRLWVYPSNCAVPDVPGDEVIVLLDPGLAFGSGTHATTALCLEWLDAMDLSGKRLLDYGCGSGILAIAALKLGAQSALGVDLDPQALIASRDNAERNAVSERLTLAEPGDPAIDAARFDLVVANILASALIELAPVICAAARSGAPIALSGILAGQEDEVIAAFAPYCRDLATAKKDDWVRVDGRRQ